jgi:hypothetical protein
VHALKKKKQRELIITSLVIYLNKSISPHGFINYIFNYFNVFFQFILLKEIYKKKENKLNKWFI